MTNKTHKQQARRDRRKAKASGFAREPQTKVGHHSYAAKFYKGAKVPT